MYTITEELSLSWGTWPWASLKVLKNVRQKSMLTSKSSAMLMWRKFPEHCKLFLKSYHVHKTVWPRASLNVLIRLMARLKVLTVKWVRVGILTTKIALAMSKVIVFFLLWEGAVWLNLDRWRVVLTCSWRCLSLYATSQSKVLRQKLNISHTGNSTNINQSTCTKQHHRSL